MSDAGSSPTRTVASPRPPSSSTSAATSARTLAASALPSMTVATARHVSLSLGDGDRARIEHVGWTQRVRRRAALLRAGEEGRVAGARSPLERAAADPGVQGLAAKARAPARPLALGDHAAAAGGHVRVRDGVAAPERGAPSRGEALLLDDGAGRVAPHRGVAEARGGGRRRGRAGPAPR